MIDVVMKNNRINMFADWIWISCVVIKNQRCKNKEKKNRLKESEHL